MTARHPFSENTLQRRNHRSPHTKPIRHKRSKRLLRKNAGRKDGECSAPKHRYGSVLPPKKSSRHPVPERQNTKSGIARARFGKRRRIYKSSDASFFWKFGRPLVPGLPATARPGSGKAPANTRRYRLREAFGPRARTVFGSETKTRPAAKTVVHTVPSFGGAGARCISSPRKAVAATDETPRRHPSAHPRPALSSSGFKRFAGCSGSFRHPSAYPVLHPVVHRLLHRLA